MSLPPEDEQEALLDALAGLVGAQGHLPLVSSHLLEPTPRYFPDAWRPDADGAANVARRLLGYAGMGGMDAAIELDVDRPAGPHGETAAAWFSGFSGSTCRFGVDVGKLEDADGLVGALCHEVAHAYRAANRLVVEDRGREEVLTDLTTVFLGFGILTTNASLQIRSRHTGATWEIRSAGMGYLEPGAMAFLLAAQATARRLDRAELRRVERHLAPDHATSFREALSRLGREGMDLERRLGLPAWPSWPPPSPLPRAGRAQALPPPSDDAPLAPEERWRRRNEGRAVFRVREHRAAQWAFAGLWLGMAAGVALWKLAGLESTAIPWASVGCAAAGLVFGANVLRYRCSTDCGATLTRETRICPGCGGEVAGEIARERDKFDAEERWRRDRGESDAGVGEDADAGG